MNLLCAESATADAAGRRRDTAGCARGEQQGAHPPPGRALLLWSGGHRPSGLGRGCLYPV